MEPVFPWFFNSALGWTWSCQEKPGCGHRKAVEPRTFLFLARRATYVRGFCSGLGLPEHGIFLLTSGHFWGENDGKRWFRIVKSCGTCPKAKVLWMIKIKGDRSETYDNLLFTLSGSNLNDHSNVYCIKCAYVCIYIYIYLSLSLVCV